MELITWLTNCFRLINVPRIAMKINLLNSINYHLRQGFVISTCKVLLEPGLVVDFGVSLSITPCKGAFLTASNP